MGQNLGHQFNLYGLEDYSPGVGLHFHQRLCGRTGCFRHQQIRRYHHGGHCRLWNERRRRAVSTMKRLSLFLFAAYAASAQPWADVTLSQTTATATPMEVYYVDPSAS